MERLYRVPKSYAASCGMSTGKVGWRKVTIKTNSRRGNILKTLGSTSTSVFPALPTTGGPQCFLCCVSSAVQAGETGRVWAGASAVAG